MIMAHLCTNILSCNTGYEKSSIKLNHKIKTEDMDMKNLKKYLFTVRYIKDKKEEFGTLSLWANNLVHANDLFKRLYCPDRCGDYAEPLIGEVINVCELANLA